MRTRITDTIGRRALLGAGLSAAAGLWLVAVEAGGHGWLSRWLLVVLVGAPTAALLAPLATRLAARPARLEAAALVALAAAAAAALGALAAGVLDVQALEPVRGLLLALAVTVPLAAVAPSRRPAPAAMAPVEVAPPARPARRPGGTTRRGFIQVGAAGSVAVAGLSRVVSATAAPPVPFMLTITEGDIVMEDGTPVFFRGFRPTDAVKDVPSLPGPPLGNVGPGVKGREIFEGDAVRIVVANSTPRDHTFLIERTAGEQPSNPAVKPTTVPAHGSVTIDFIAPEAGSYVYRDADRNNRVLGMYGAFIVQPLGFGGTLLPYAPAPDRVVIETELRSQLTWVLSDVDPVLGELARTQRRESTISYPLSSIKPRYFLINGQTGVEATHDAAFTVPVVPLQLATDKFVGVLIRCINAGIVTHALHWHGNHIFPVQSNGVPAKLGVVYERDMQRMEPLVTVDVILPAHTGFDAFPPINDKHPKSAEQHFPMHCHAEMSQTAAGGSYPFGMLTDWHLVSTTQVAREVRQRLADEARDGRRRVPDDVVQAAIEERTGNSGSGGGRGDSGGTGGGGSSGGGSSGGGSGGGSSGDTSPGSKGDGKG